MVAQTVRVLAPGLQAHEVHHIHKADSQIGKVSPQQVAGGETLQRRYVAGGGHHHVRLSPWSLLAHSQIPIPRTQWGIVSSMESQSSSRFLPATITFT